MKKSILWAIALSFLPFILNAQVGGWDPKGLKKAEEAKNAFIEQDSSLQTFFNEAYAFAIFPNIGKGGLIVGGAHGSGHVFEQGEPIGTAKLTQVTLGLQIGGQSYMEVLFFQTEADLNRFRAGALELAAQASAVAVEQGSSGNIAYEDGVAIFTMSKGGIMAEASIGGQKFKYKPFIEKERFKLIESGEEYKR